MKLPVQPAAYNQNFEQQRSAIIERALSVQPANTTAVVSETTQSRQTFSATAGQTAFSIASGYTVGMIDVFLNGAKLANGTDFTATNGTSITLTSAAALNDIVDVVATSVGADYTIWYLSATASETAAAVVPTDLTYLPGDIRRYGAACDGVTDDSAAINSALSVGGRIIIPAGMTTLGTSLTMAVAGTELVIEAGATLSNTTATNKCITVSGANCTISGSGRILSPATFVTVNSQRTYAVLWITGDGSLITNITIENVPWAGIHYEASTRHRLSDVRVNGNFPYADVTVNDAHFAVDYDPSTSTYDNDVGLTVTGCHISTCMVGVFLGNYGAAPLEGGIAITGNTFSRCWGHAIYLIGDEGASITGNNFLNCRIAVVTSGVSPTVCGNAVYNTEPSKQNRNASFSIRDASDATITGNTFYGYSAGILITNVSGTAIRGNLVANNTIRHIGVDTHNTCISLGSGTLTETCTDNVIANNTIYASAVGEFNGVIQLQMKSTFYGERNFVHGNMIRQATPGYSQYGIYVLRQKYAAIFDNVISNNDVAAGALTVNLMLLSDCASCRVSGNSFVWTEGGTNITARGIAIAAGCTAIRVLDNEYHLTAAGLTAAVGVSDSGTGTVLIQANLIADAVAVSSVAEADEVLVLQSGVHKSATIDQLTAAIFGEDWTDLRFPAQGINPSGTASPPTVVTSLSGYTGCLEFSGSAENIIAGVAQMPHEWKRGSTVKPHIHWTKPTGSSSAVTWEFYYRIIGNPGDTAGAWSSAQSGTIAAGDQTVSDEHIITSFPDIDLSAYIESAIILWRVHRQGATDADNTAVILFEFDIHYQKDKAGTESPIPS